MTQERPEGSVLGLGRGLGGAGRTSQRDPSARLEGRVGRKWPFAAEVEAWAPALASGWDGQTEFRLYSVVLADN